MALSNKKKLDIFKRASEDEKAFFYSQALKLIDEYRLLVEAQKEVINNLETQNSLLKVVIEKDRPNFFKEVV